MKVYVNFNHDGRHSTMVAAENMKAAAALMHTSPHHMREYGWTYARSDEAEIALASPGQVFWRKIMAGGPWLTERSAR